MNNMIDGLAILSIELVSDPKKPKPAKLLMEWPNALSALTEKDEEDLDGEPQSLQTLLASVLEGLFMQ